METKEQLQNLVTKKWRKIQAWTLLSVVVGGIYAYFDSDQIIAGFSIGLCFMALSHEWIIHYYIPEYNCDELRRELGRKS